MPTPTSDPLVDAIVHALSLEETPNLRVQGKCASCSTTLQASIPHERSGNVAHTLTSKCPWCGRAIYFRM